MSVGRVGGKTQYFGRPIRREARIESQLDEVHFDPVFRGQKIECRIDGKQVVVRHGAGNSIEIAFLFLTPSTSLDRFSPPCRIALNGNRISRLHEESSVVLPDGIRLRAQIAFVTISFDSIITQPP